MSRKENVLEKPHRSLIMYSGVIHDICESLFKNSDINNFAYAEIRNGGKLLFLCSDPHLLTQMTKRGSSPISPLRVLKYHHQTGYYASDLHASQYFFTGSLLEQIAHFALGRFLITIEHEIRGEEKVIKVYRYGGHFNKQQPNMFYVDHFAMLQKFNRYFDKRMGSFLVEQMPINLDISYRTEFDKYVEHFNKSPDSILNVFDETTVVVTKFAPDGLADVRLSQCEMAIIKLYFQGFTGQQTAELLHMSRRTVERHFERINKKLDCQSKSDIKVKLGNIRYDIFELE